MDAVIATSRKTAAYLERDATVILHGIDTERFHPPRDSAAAKRALKLPEQDIFIGCFGRIRHQKGTDVFVEAMIEICKADRRVRGAILGRATERHLEFRKRLEAKIRNAGLHHRIRMLPEVPVDEIAAWYRALDLFVAPQRWEGFDLTPLEAMACGVPVAATRVGAFDEIIADGVTGHMIDAGDKDAMIAAINACLSDQSRLQDMGRAARAHVVGKFKIEKEAEEILNVYARLLADGEKA